MPVVVNGTEISDRAIKAEFNTIRPRRSRMRARRRRALVIRELLQQATDRLGIVDVEPIADPKTGRRETREEP